jgi:hypothetical protein
MNYGKKEAVKISKTKASKKQVYFMDVIMGHTTILLLISVNLQINLN